jgi:hypothetical protein
MTLPRVGFRMGSSCDDAVTRTMRRGASLASVKSAEFLSCRPGADPDLADFAGLAAVAGADALQVTTVSEV